ncbi:MAG: acyl-CoA thioesterase [Henriciella sp.]|nr:acyl-CoA thioesterase [Henriciella sp.]
MRSDVATNPVRGALRKLLLPEAFAIEVTASDADIDAFNHVNNAVYLKWMNDCAAAHSAAVGLPAEACVTLDRGMAVRETKLLYQHPARLGDEIIIANWVTQNDGRLRASRAFQILRRSDDTTLLLGASKYACIALSTGRPVRMPDIFRDKYRVDQHVERQLLADADLRSRLLF